MIVHLVSLRTLSILKEANQMKALQLQNIFQTPGCSTKDPQTSPQMAKLKYAEVRKHSSPHSNTHSLLLL